MADKIRLLDQSAAEIESLLTEMGEKKFRGGQIFQWLHRGIKDMDEMTNIPKKLRETLSRVADIDNLKIAEKHISQIDGTVKYLFELYDGNIIESVLMEYKHGLTVCVSSQVGCKMGCRFCASTGVGFVRNLHSGEMLDQVLRIQSDAGQRIGNVVVMGIGEPLDNYISLVKFLRLLNSPDGLNIGYRHMTVSTCGLVPGIAQLSEENIPINLSVSLHAPNDTIRESLMPVAGRYSIDKIIEICKIYTEMTRRRVTFEYAMINGVNDSKAHASELSQRIKGMLCHVNIIPVNPVAGTDYKQSSRAKAEEFKSILEKCGIETTIRRELGTDIMAACGQLRRSTMGR